MDNIDTYKKAYELWIWYEYQCEIYDKVVCTGKEDSNGFIRPTNSIENRLIGTHADMIRNLVIDKLNEYKITDEVCKNAMEDKNKLTWKGIQQEYKRIYESV